MRISLMTAIPGLVVLCSYSLLGGFTVRNYLRMREAGGQTGRVDVGPASISIQVPQNQFFRFGFERASVLTEHFTMVMNAPAAFVSLPFLTLAEHWSRAAWWTLPWVWKGLTFPLLAIPAWMLVGYSIEALLSERRMLTWVAVGSGLLAGVCATLAIGLRIDESRPGRLVDETERWYVIGLAVWAFLLIAALIAWAHQRRLQRG
jgi:hypothetical protein